MAGHSKWANIKRRKGAVDAARGKIFTRLTREIQVAARAGDDPDANFTLRLAVERARAENMPRDTIDRAIRRGAGKDKDAAQYEEVTYEGYGPHGVALLIECLSDNRNRTIAEVRRVFNRANSALAEPNAVAWQFTRRGLILVEADAGEAELDGEDVFMEALEAGAEDIEEDDGTFEIYTEGTALAQTADSRRQAGLPVRSVELIMHPNQTIDLAPGDAKTVLRMVEALEDLDDVKQVFHNLTLNPEVLVEMAG